MLKQTLRRVQTEGRPALVTVVGPAGVGKSRLVHELQRYVEALPEFVYWRRGRCLAYGNTSYSALADAIKAQCEILDDDPADVAAKKANAMVRELFGDDSARTADPRARRRGRGALVQPRGPVRCLAPLPGADGRALPARRSSSRTCTGPTTGCWTSSSTRPTWRRGRSCCSRSPAPSSSRRVRRWGGGKRNAASIYLDPLSVDEGGAMLADLLGSDLTAEVRDLIVERSEGNPLYVEEIVRMLIDDGVLRATEASRWEVARPVADVEVPRSIQGLIAARLDGLPDDEKTFLQDAAVVGRVFWTGAVATLAGDGSGRVARRARPPARQGAGAAARAVELLRRAGVLVPSQPDPRRRVRLAAEGAPRREARAGGPMGPGARRRPGGGDRGADRHPLPRGDAGTWTSSGSPATSAPRSTRRGTDGRAPPGTARRRSGNAPRRCAGTARRSALADAVGSDDGRSRVARPAADGGRVWPPNRPAATRTPRVSPSTSTRRSATSRTPAGPRRSSRSRSSGWARTRRRTHEAIAAIARLEPLGESEALAVALQTLSQYLVRRGRDEEGEPIVRRALAMAERVGAPVVVADATQTLAMTLSQQGRTEEAVETIEEAYRLAKAGGRRDGPPARVQQLPVDRVGIRVGPSAGDRGAPRGDRARRAGRRDRQPRLAAGHALRQHRGARATWRRRSGRSGVSRARRGVGRRIRCRDPAERLAWVVFQRGRVDEAEELQRRAVDDPRTRTANPRPTCTSSRPRPRSRSQRGTRRRSARAPPARGRDVARVHARPAPLLFYELVRLLLRTGDRADAEGYRDLSDARPGTGDEGLRRGDRRAAGRRRPTERPIDSCGPRDAFERLGLRIVRRAC